MRFIRNLFVGIVIGIEHVVLVAAVWCERFLCTICACVGVVFILSIGEGAVAYISQCEKLATLE